MTLNPNAQDAALTPTPTPDTEDRMLTPLALWKRYGVPRDLIYEAIHCHDLPAYNAGRGGKPRFLVSLTDFKTWLETLRVGQK